MLTTFNHFREDLSGTLNLTSLCRGMFQTWDGRDAHHFLSTTIVIYTWWARVWFCSNTVPSRETWDSCVVGIASRVVTSICDHPLFKQYMYISINRLARAYIPYLITTRLLIGLLHSLHHGLFCCRCHSLHVTVVLVHWNVHTCMTTESQNADRLEYLSGYTTSQLFQFQRRWWNGHTDEVVSRHM